ncbi:MAG: crossover junction endodeoxyribonuclease RuvC [bacterium]|nr:crossover junction endodeoxyribonuclease RuvC [Deltaproteobacteria bacterium]MCP4905452.1 crossover junction endodeoxyribonuclease RuvC [bacterium]
MRVLGVDPGSNATGFGLIVREGGHVRHLCHGVLRPPKGAELSDRLHFLHTRLAAVLRVEKPEVAVVERVFLAANPRSALVLGQARGALLASLGEAGVRVAEIAAREAKKAITGSGAADKVQMQTMVTRLLKLDESPPADAADALALALSYAHSGALAGLPSRGRGRNNRRAMTEIVTGRTR